MKFCDGCEAIKPNELEQTNKKESHICRFTGKKLRHNGHHPYIPMPHWCPGEQVDDD